MKSNHTIRDPPEGPHTGPFPFSSHQLLVPVIGRGWRTCLLTITQGWTWDSIWLSINNISLPADFGLLIDLHETARIPFILIQTKQHSSVLKEQNHEAEWKRKYSTYENQAKEIRHGLVGLLILADHLSPLTFAFHFHWHSPSSSALVRPHIFNGKLRVCLYLFF